MRPRLLTRPPRIEATLSRPRLVDAAGADRLVVLAAATGSGATTAAAQLAAARHGPVRWARMAPGFATAADLVAMLTGADDDELATLPLLALGDRLLESLEAEPATVVVDDLDRADSGEVERLLAECVSLLPDGASVIATSRTRPATLLGLTRAAETTALDASELAFRDDEAAALFELLGSSPDHAAPWNAELRGWAAGLVAGAASGAPGPTGRLGSLILTPLAADDAARQVVSTAAALPYVNDVVIEALSDRRLTAGIDVPVAEVAATFPLLVDHDGIVRLDEAVAAQLRDDLDATWVTNVRSAAAETIAASDPTTAIDLLLAAGAHEAAANVLGDHLSEIGVERALTWLYQMPDDLRRRFPPVLAAGQATVEVDTALATAQARVETAVDARARSEALLALGSVEAYRGELGAAASAYEAALRASDDPAFAARVADLLAEVRLLLGDLAGASSALANTADTASSRWLRAQLTVLTGTPSPEPSDATTPDDAALDLAAAALLAARDGDGDRAMDAARRAYEQATDTGGDDLVAAAPLHAWTLLAAGRADEATTVAEQLERRLGPGHRLARVHGAVIRERASRGGDDRSLHERDERRLRDLRSTGFAAVERLADATLAALAPGAAASAPDESPTLVVHVLGEHELVVDGRIVGRSAWKSKKAFEVLSVLALAGPPGRRREEVIESVWPGRPPDKGRTLLRTALSEIRRTLEPGRPAGEPSAYVTAVEDRLLLEATTDLDVALGQVDLEPVVAFGSLSAGVAPEVLATEWGAELEAVAARHAIDAATRVRDRAALEFLIEAEPWNRAHVDELIELHREAGDDAAAATVERRWFEDD